MLRDGSNRRFRQNARCRIHSTAALGRPGAGEAVGVTMKQAIERYDTPARTQRVQRLTYSPSRGAVVATGSRS